jgi:hypothetical protein
MALRAEKPGFGPKINPKAVILAQAARFPLPTKLDAKVQTRIHLAGRL